VAGEPETFYRTTVRGFFLQKKLAPESILNRACVFIIIVFQVYPKNDITNIVESSHYVKIGNWCKMGYNKCKHTDWVKPYRCLGKCSPTFIYHDSGARLNCRVVFFLFDRRFSPVRKSLSPKYQLRSPLHPPTHTHLPSPFLKLQGPRSIYTVFYRSRFLFP